MRPQSKLGLNSSFGIRTYFVHTMLILWAVQAMAAFSPGPHYSADFDHLYVVPTLTASSLHPQYRILELMQQYEAKLFNARPTGSTRQYAAKLFETRPTGPDLQSPFRNQSTTCAPAGLSATATFVGAATEPAAEGQRGSSSGYRSVSSRSLHRRIAEAGNTARGVSSPLPALLRGRMSAGSPQMESAGSGSVGYGLSKGASRCGSDAFSTGSRRSGTAASQMIHSFLNTSYSTEAFFRVSFLSLECDVSEVCQSKCDVFRVCNSVMSSG